VHPPAVTLSTTPARSACRGGNAHTIAMMLVPRGTVGNDKSLLILRRTDRDGEGRGRGGGCTA
jgi:hypothetical protein